MSKKTNQAHQKSVQVCNTKLTDTKNKKRKPKSHIKQHPRDLVDLFIIMKNYIARHVLRLSRKS